MKNNVAGKYNHLKAISRTKLDKFKHDLNKKILSLKTAVLN